MELSELEIITAREKEHSYKHIYAPYLDFRQSILISRQHYSLQQPYCECKEKGENCKTNKCSNVDESVLCSPKCSPRCQNSWAEDVNSEKWMELFTLGTKDIGVGVRAKTDIKKGLIVGEYVGEFVCARVYEERKQTKYKSNKHYYGMFVDYKTTGRGDYGSVMDSSLEGNVTRFINHCNRFPNLKVEIWRYNGFPRIYFRALCTIPKGAELTYDYKGLVKDENWDPEICLCSNCTPNENATPFHPLLSNSKIRMTTESQNVKGKPLNTRSATSKHVVKNNQGLADTICTHPEVNSQVTSQDDTLQAQMMHNENVELTEENVVDSEVQEAILAESVNEDDARNKQPVVVLPPAEGVKRLTLIQIRARLHFEIASDLALIRCSKMGNYSHLAFSEKVQSAFSFLERNANKPDLPLFISMKLLLLQFEINCVGAAHLRICPFCDDLHSNLHTKFLVKKHFIRHEVAKIMLSCNKCEVCTHTYEEMQSHFRKDHNINRPEFTRFNKDKNWGLDLMEYKEMRAQQGRLFNHNKAKVTKFDPNCNNKSLEKIDIKKSGINIRTLEGLGSAVTPTTVTFESKRIHAPYAEWKYICSDARGSEKDASSTPKAGPSEQGPSIEENPGPSSLQDSSSEVAGSAIELVSGDISVTASAQNGNNAGCLDQAVVKVNPKENSTQLSVPGSKRKVTPNQPAKTGVKKKLRQSSTSK